MKKFVALLLAALVVFSLAACTQQGGTTDPTKKAEDAVSTEVLEDKDHAIWTALGQYLLEDGTQNGWGDKSAEVFEKSALKAISMADLKEISEDLYNALKNKEVKYLYTINLLFGTNDAGWQTNCLIDGKLYRANGSFAFKLGQCSVDMDGDDKVYSVDQWISDPKTAYVESLTPATAFYPTWQEAKDENGFAWDQNPVCIGGAGLYTLVIAQYKNASSEGNPGYGVGLILKEKKDAFAEYEEIVTFNPAEHTYGIIGSFEASGWGTDVAMEADTDNTWKGEVELKAGDEWKVRADGDWADSWGEDGYNGANFKAEEDGTYIVTITFEGETGTVTFEKK